MFLIPAYNTFRADYHPLSLITIAKELSLMIPIAKECVVIGEYRSWVSEPDSHNDFVVKPHATVALDEFS